MNYRLLLPLALLTLSAPALAEVRYHKTLQVEIPADQPFAVENLAGEFRVVAGDGDAVVVTAKLHAASQELVERIRLERVEGVSARATYRIRYPYDDVKTFRYPGPTVKDGAGSWFSNMFGGSNTTADYDDRRVKINSSSGTLLFADVEVVVPRRAIDGRFRNLVGHIRAQALEGDFVFATASGDVALNGLAGRIEVATGSGDLEAKQMRGSLEASAGSGDLNIHGFDGETLQFSVGSGDVELGAVTATKIVAETGSGDIEASGITTGVFEASTGSGSVEVTATTAQSFEVSTGSGDVLIQGDGSRVQSVAADTGSGDVTLRLGSQLSFEAIAEQGSGDLVNRYRDADAIVKGRYVVGYRRGDARTKIKVETGSGDVVIEPGG